MRSYRRSDIRGQGQLSRDEGNNGGECDNLPFVGLGNPIRVRGLVSSGAIVELKKLRMLSIRFALTRGILV